MKLQDLPINPRYIIGLIIILMMGVLMYLGTIETEIGITIIIGVAAALGLYEKQSSIGSSK